MIYVLKKFTTKNWLFIGLIFLLTLVQVFFTMEIVGSVNGITGTITNINPKGVPPLVVIQTIDEVCEVIFLANKNKIPMSLYVFFMLTR